LHPIPTRTRSNRSFQICLSQHSQCSRSVFFGRTSSFIHVTARGASFFFPPCHHCPSYFGRLFSPPKSVYSLPPTQNFFWPFFCSASILFLFFFFYGSFVVFESLAFFLSDLLAPPPSFSWVHVHFVCHVQSHSLVLFSPAFFFSPLPVHSVFLRFSVPPSPCFFLTIMGFLLFLWASVFLTVSVFQCRAPPRFQSCLFHLEVVPPSKFFPTQFFAPRRPLSFCCNFLFQSGWGPFSVFFPQRLFLVLLPPSPHPFFLLFFFFLLNPAFSFPFCPDSRSPPSSFFRASTLFFSNCFPSTFSFLVSLFPEMPPPLWVSTLASKVFHFFSFFISFWYLLSPKFVTKFDPPPLSSLLGHQGYDVVVPPLSCISFMLFSLLFFGSLVIVQRRFFCYVPLRGVLSLPPPSSLLKPSPSFSPHTSFFFRLHQTLALFLSL